MGTQLDSSNILEFPLQILSTAPLSAPLPTSPWPTALDPAFYSVLGRVTDSGFDQARDLNNTQINDSTGALVFDADNQLRESITCTALETNNVTEGLKYPNAIKTTIAPGTPEVQTVTVSGAPTGGSFTPVYKSIPASTTIASGAAGSAFQTALRTIPALATATVTGSGPYVVNMPASEGNADLLQFVNQLTGGTSPTVTAVETTPGTLPVYKWVTTTSGILSVAKRLYILDEVNLASGRAQRKAFVGKAKATGLGASTAGTPKQTPFTILKYEDVLIGGLEAIISTLPAHNPALAGF